MSIAIQEVVKPGWGRSLGEAIKWYPGLGTSLQQAPSDFPVHSESSNEDEQEILLEWLLLAVAEPFEPNAVDDDSAKAAFVKLHRGFGTALVKEESFDEAAAAYTRALDVCRLHSGYRSFFPKDDGSLVNGCSVGYGAQSFQPHKMLDADGLEAYTWVRDAAIACNLNLALCALRRSRFDDCLKHAGWVLTSDPHNVKALYRRGIATATLGSDLEAALSDLRAAQKLEPSNAAVAKEILQLKEKAKAARKREQVMFRGTLSDKNVGVENKKAEGAKLNALAAASDGDDRRAMQPLSANMRNRCKSETHTKEKVAAGLMGFSASQKLRLFFTYYDDDEDGFISKGDLFKLVKMMAKEKGLSLEDAQIEQMVGREILRVDKDGDGAISFAEFERAVSHL
jgi:tetratricopeptide (TPR) repeat protein